MLSAYITDLLGEHLALVKAIPARGGGNQTSAGVDLCGPRVASVRVSMSDETSMLAIRARTGSRMLKVYYRPPSTTVAKLVAWCFLGRPILNFTEGVAVLNATDATMRLKRAFKAHHGPLDPPDGVTVDSRGLRAIHLQALFANAALEAPTPGVWPYGSQMGPNFDGKMALADGQDYQGFIDTISDTAVGPDWDLLPIDTTLGERPSLDPSAGFTEAAYDDFVANLASTTRSTIYSELRCYERKANDLRDTIHFGFGTGPDNLAGLEIEVAGEQTVNANEVTLSGGDEDTTKSTQTDSASIAQIGLYEAQTSVSADPKAGDQADFATETAKAQVAAYKEAPIFLTLTVKKDELARFYAFHNFEHGDLVRVSAEAGFALIPYRGDYVKEVIGRVTKIDLEEDAQGRVQQKLTVVVDVTEEEV